MTVSFRSVYLRLSQTICFLVICGVAVAPAWGQDEVKEQKVPVQSGLADVLAPPVSNDADTKKREEDTDDSDSADKPGDPSDKIDVPAGNWTVRFLDKNPSSRKRPVPKNSNLKVLDDLQLIGAKMENQHLLGEFRSKGEWAWQQGYLLPTEKQDSALRIGFVEDFELQGIWNVEGRGGWFILLGYEDGHGYVLENTTFISSGSPWHLAELRGGRGIPDSFREVSRYDWEGDQAVRLSVKNKELTLKVGDEDLIVDEPLDNYGPGELIIGTFRGRYAPKPLKIRSLRIRSLK